MTGQAYTQGHEREEGAAPVHRKEDLPICQLSGARTEQPAIRECGEKKTDPINADYPPPSFPNLAIRWKETCSEEYRCHYTHNQHRCFITPKVNWLLLLATCPVVDCNTRESAQKKGQVLVLPTSSSVFYLVTQV